MNKLRHMEVCTLIIAILMLSFTCIGFANNGDTPWDNYARAAELFAQNASSEEILILCKNAQKETDDPLLFARVSLLQAQVLAKQKEMRKAHKILVELYSGKKELPEAVVSEALLRDAQLYLQVNQDDGALILLRMVAEKTSSTFLQQEARLALARQFADANNWQKCDSLLLNIVRDQPAYDTDERVLVLRARHNIANNEPETAISFLQRSQGKEALRYLAQAYELTGKPIMAVGVYKKIHDRFPESSEAEEALFQAGEVFMRSEDWIAARSQFNRLLQHFPNSHRAAVVYFRLGWIYLQRDEYEEALNAFRSGSTSENQSYMSFMEAECLRRMGANQPEKLQEAIVKYNSIIALYPNSPLAPMAKLRSALTWFEKGDSTDALISLRQFLALYPKDDLASAATFLLATHVENSKSRIYFNEILHQYPSGNIFDAALVALQKQDYDAGAYQEVINRKAHFQSVDISHTQNYFQRAHHFILAESAYYLRQYEPARKKYALASLNVEDDLSQKAALGDAWCLLQSGQLDSAIKALKELHSRYTGVNYVHASFGLATAFFRLKRYEEAIQTYPSNIGNDTTPDLIPLLVKSLYRIGECYYRLEYYSQAIEMWEKLVQEYPESELAPQAKFKVADTYFRANHFDEAIVAFQSIIENYPDGHFAEESTLRVAQCEYNAGKYSEAIANFENFIKTYPQNEYSNEALEGIQLCYYQLGQMDQASEALEKVIEQFPNALLSADARFQLATNHLKANKYEEAIQAFKEILTLYPGSSYSMDAQFALAQAYVEKKDSQSANKEFTRFIQYFPDSPQLPEAVFNLAVGYFNLESYLSASDYFNQIIEQFPESDFHMAALQNIGWCFDRLGDKKKALHFLNSYVQKYPKGDDLQMIKLQIARIKADTGDFQKAIAIFQKLKMSKDNEIAVEAAYRLGTANLDVQNVKAAKEAFNFAAKKGKIDNYYRLSALSQLGAIYETAQDWKPAIAAYKQLADSAPEESWVIAATERINALQPMLTEN